MRFWLNNRFYYHTVIWMCEDAVMSWEKHLSSNHLSQDAGSRPDIHWEGERQNFNNKIAMRYSVLCLTNWKRLFVLIKGGHTCLTVVHPVEYDLWCSVPSRHNITGHFALCLSCQAKIQDLRKVPVRFTPQKLERSFWSFLFSCCICCISAHLCLLFCTLDKRVTLQQK